MPDLIIALALMAFVFVGNRSVILNGILYVILCAVIIHSVQTELGRARLASWSDTYSGRLIAYETHQPKTVDIWLQEKGHAHPTYLRFPWTEQKAKQLQRAAENGMKTHSAVMLGHKPNHHLPPGQKRSVLNKGKLVFYNSQIVPLPPKTNRN